MIICAKYGRNPSRSVDFFSRSRPKIFKNLPKIQISRFWKKRNTPHPLIIVIICAKYKNNPSRTVDATERTRFFKSRSNDLEDICQGQGSSQATHLSHAIDHLYQIWKESILKCRCYRRTRKFKGQTDRRTDRQTNRQGEFNIPP